MNELDTRQLRHFVALAEELNFSRAARRIPMTQQSLSASIARLEREIGTALFTRTTRRVELTDAGRAMLPSARVALAAADDALAAARQAQPYAGMVVFGLSSGLRYGMEDLFARIARHYPNVMLDVRHDSALPLVEQLRAGHIDVAALFALPVPDDLVGLPLPERPLVLAVSGSHPLAGVERVSLADVRGETFALDTPGHNPAYDAAVLDACRSAGFEPRTRVSRAEHDSWEAGVHEHGCVGLTVRDALHASHRDLHLIEVAETLTIPVNLVWGNDIRHPVRAVIAAARALTTRSPTEV